MIPAVGTSASLSHYSLTHPIKCIITDIVKDDCLKLRLSKEFALFNFFENDPLTLGHETNGDIYISECRISGVDMANRHIKIEIVSTELIAERRASDRYPVSFYGRLKSDARIKNDMILIKTVSLDDMGIRSEIRFEDEQIIEFDAYFDKTIIPITASVIWKSDCDTCFEYGTKLIHNSVNSRNSLKLNIQLLKDEQEKAIRDLKIYW